MDWHPLILSLEVAAMATLFTTLIGVGFATLLTARRLPGREFIDAVVTLPLVMPPTVLGYYLLVSLGRNSAFGGWYEKLFGSTLLFSVKGCVIAASIGSLPLVVKTARTALEGVDERLLAAARTLGAKPARVFLTVRLPLAMRGITAGVMLGFARALGDFGMTLMVGGDIPGHTQTAPLYIYDAWQAGKEDQMRAMVLVLTVVAVVIMLAANHMSRSRRE